jgi:hypothetical protein
LNLSVLQAGVHKLLPRRIQIRESKVIHNKC